MGLSFVKQHGLGNDFVVFDARRQPIPLSAEAVRAVADRRTGVGCDQLMIIGPAGGSGADVTLRIFNADGGEVAACGNGTRCVAGLLLDETDAETVRIATAAGDLTSRRAAGGAVTVDMGPAASDWRDIPLAEAVDTLALPITEGVLDTPTAVAIGNPHAAFFVEHAEAVPLERLGPVVEHHPLFPERTNVEAVSVVGKDRLRMRVWERGVGITRACGTGACAAFVAAARRGLTGRRGEVVLDGGTLAIEWRGDGHVEMTGPVATSFTGVLDDGLLGRLDPTVRAA